MPNYGPPPPLALRKEYPDVFPGAIVPGVGEVQSWPYRLHGADPVGSLVRLPAGVWCVARRVVGDATTWRYVRLDPPRRGEEVEGV